MIVVFGSINLDLVARVERLPRAGETLAGSSFATSPGGKGANQALAARRAGAEVSMFGAVGRDAFAAPAQKLLRDDGVRIAVRVIGDEPTGVALIHVASDGENAITVVPGANAHVVAEDVPDVLLGPTTMLLLQLETPVAQSLSLAKRARSLGTRVMLNAAPAAALDRQWLAAIDVLVVNETECEAIAPVFGLPRDPSGFVAGLARGHRVLGCVTLGARGAVAASGTKRYRVPGASVLAIDTVGAGDAFVGTLGAALDASLPVSRALAHATAAGALACTREGAQAALPRLQEIATLAMTLESRIEASPLAQ